MSKLILARFHCVTDTDELGSESPYFLTYVGNLSTGKGKLKLTRQGNWENEVDKGEKWTVNHIVFDGLLNPTSTIALSAMVEEDEGLDVTDDERKNVIEFSLNKALVHWQGAGVTKANDIAGTMSVTFRNALKGALVSASGADDDYMGVKRIKLISGTGELKLISFFGGGGQYNVRYAQA